jgi:hypothetical protein
MIRRAHQQILGYASPDIALPGAAIDGMLGI